MSSTVRVRAASDAWVDQALPAKEHGNTTKLEMSSLTGSQRRAFIHFPVAIAPSAFVISAKLRLYARGDQWTGTTPTVSVQRVSQGWREGKVNWNNQPSVAGTAATVVANNLDQGDLIEVDVTNIIQSKANGAAFYGLRIQTSGNAMRALYATEASNPEFHPLLVVVWADELTPPQELSPDGSRAVSTDTPLLSWISFEQSQFHYLIYEDSTLANLLYDSGWIVSEVSESVSGYALADGESVAWRVQTRNEEGIESNFSDIAVFHRSDLGVITITAPAGPDPGVVDETTPPFIHTFSGTQVSASWTLERFAPSNAQTAPQWVTLYELEKHDTTDTTFTPPPKLITNETSLYRIIIRVWDDEEREGIAGAPPYAEATREFTYTAAGTVTAVSTLTATQVGPGVLLHWTRATTPDHFTLMVGDDIKVEPIDPADAQVSANNWEYTWYGARPNHAETYEVEAVVLDAGKLKHSTGNPTQSKTLGFGPAFLLIPELAYVVPILGGGVQDTPIGMDYEIVNIPGRRRPVKVTSRIGGYEGTIEGYIKGDATYGTAQSQRDKLEVAQGLADESEVRVCYADHNFPVIIEPITFTPMENQQWHVVISFIQVDEFTFEMLGG